MQELFDQFQPDNPRFRENPYPLYRHLQAKCPIAYRPEANDWLVTGYKEVRQLLLSSEIRNSSELEKESDVASEVFSNPIEEVLKAKGAHRHHMLINLSGDRHRKIRSIFGKYFAPDNLNKYRPILNDLARNLIEQFASDSQIDIVTQYANPFSLGVLTRLLGIPEGDQKKIQKWVQNYPVAIDLTSGGANENAVRKAVILHGLSNYYVQFKDRAVQDDEGGNQDSLFREMLCASAEQDISAEELQANIILLLLAGYENSQNTVSMAIHYLLNNPDQLKDFRENPRLIGAVIDETLRFGSPLHCQAVVVNAPLVVSGHLLEPGQRICLLVAAANRDPNVFENPDVFNIRRQSKKHLSFGVGPHFCLGFALAKMEIEIALKSLIDTFPNLRLCPNGVERIDLFNANGYKHLNVFL